MSDKRYDLSIRKFKDLIKNKSYSVVKYYCEAGECAFVELESPFYQKRFFMYIPSQYKMKVSEIDGDIQHIHEVDINTNSKQLDYWRTISEVDFVSISSHCLYYVQSDLIRCFELLSKPYDSTKNIKDIEDEKSVDQIKELEKRSAKYIDRIKGDREALDVDDYKTQMVHVNPSKSKVNIVFEDDNGDVVSEDNPIEQMIEEAKREKHPIITHKIEKERKDEKKERKDEKKERKDEKKDEKLLLSTDEETSEEFEVINKKNNEPLSTSTEEEEFVLKISNKEKPDFLQSDSDNGSKSEDSQMFFFSSSEEEPGLLQIEPSFIVDNDDFEIGQMYICVNLKTFFEVVKTFDDELSRKYSILQQKEEEENEKRFREVLEMIDEYKKKLFDEYSKISAKNREEYQKIKRLSKILIATKQKIESEPYNEELQKIYNDSLNLLTDLNASVVERRDMIFGLISDTRLYLKELLL